MFVIICALISLRAPTGTCEPMSRYRTRYVCAFRKNESDSRRNSTEPLTGMLSDFENHMGNWVRMRRVPRIENEITSNIKTIIFGSGSRTSRIRDDVLSRTDKWPSRDCTRLFLRSFFAPAAAILPGTTSRRLVPTYLYIRMYNYDRRLYKTNGAIFFSSIPGHLFKPPTRFARMHDWH